MLMRARRFGALLVLMGGCLVGLSLAGCGEDAGEDLGRGTKAGAGGGSSLSKPPPSIWPVVMTFDLDLQRARKTGRIEQDADEEQVLTRVMEVVRRRLKAAKVGEVGVERRGDHGFQVGFLRLEVARRDELVELITRSGTLAFHVEVLPDHEYESRRRGTGDDKRSVRRGVWPGTAAEFEQFKQDEVAAWMRAQDADEHYVPSRPGFRLVREVGKDGSSTRHFHVLEVPTPPQRFDARMLSGSYVGQDQMSRPVVNFDIRTQWQDAFAAWTGLNVGLPMAIVVEGEWFSAPVIQARLSTNVQISLGAGASSDLQREAVALAAVLGAGAMLLPPDLVSTEEH